MKKLLFFLFSFFFLLYLSFPAYALMARDTVKPSEGTCMKTGCSGQICSDQNVMSTCEYREEYACYKTAVCERQANGRCGWTQTDELQRCLEGNSKPLEPEVPRRIFPTCIPRPACLDQRPACKIAIRPEFCPPSQEITPRVTCTPRPACLDQEPYCVMPEGSNFCPPETTPILRPTSILPQPVSQPPLWITIFPPPIKNLLELLYNLHFDLF